MLGYFTVITRDYLSSAHSLMAQLKRHDPNSPRWIFIVDVDYGRELSSSDLATYVGVEEFFKEGLMSFLHFKYDAFELSNVARPHAHRFIQNRTECDHWIYLDTDIYPLRALGSLFDESMTAEIFLSPHQTVPGHHKNSIELEKRLLSNGTFNSGFLALRRGKESQLFIQWFIDRCHWRCFNRFEDCFVDQLWLNLVPTLFKKYHILEAKGANIGYWNFHERKDLLEMGGNTTDPLYFLHFSGWNPDTPERLSRYSEMPASKVWIQYARKYDASLLENKVLNAITGAYRWGQYEDGSSIDLSERRKFASLYEKGLWDSRLSPFSHTDALKEKPLSYRQRIRNLFLRLFKDTV